MSNLQIHYHFKLDFQIVNQKVISASHSQQLLKIDTRAPFINIV